MAFSFGATPSTGFGAAPAGAPTGAFGSPTPSAPSFFGAPTATASASFGIATPAPAFGAPANPAPTGLFGAPAVAAPGTPAFGGFGTSAAPPSVFGSNTSAPSAFGAPAGAAPAPSTFGGFGFGARVSSAPPPGGSLFGGFGSTPAPTGGLFGSSTPSNTLFGAPPATVAPVQAQQPQREHIAGHKYYNQLTPDVKHAIDLMHDAIMRHKQTMNDVQSIGPSVLQSRPALASLGRNLSGGTAATITPLQEQIRRLQTQIVILQRDVTKLSSDMQEQTKANEKNVSQTITYAKWPLEALAARQRVHLTTTKIEHSTHITNEEEKKNEEAAHEMQLKIRDVLNQGMAAVDRIDRMPSPYYWETLQSIEQRTRLLSERVEQIKSQWDQRESSWYESLIPDDLSSGTAVTTIVETQHLAILRLMPLLDSLHNEMHRVRLRYGKYERGENVLDRATALSLDRERKLNEQALSHFLHATESTTQPGAAPASNLYQQQLALGSALRPSTFGAPAAPAPSVVGGFGAPAVSSVGGFGAPALPSVGGFGAPALPSVGGFGAPSLPSVGGFGAPAATSVFGASAPTFGAPAATSVFGSGAPAPTTNLFGGNSGAVAAPAPVGFGNFTPSPGLSTKKKNPPRGSIRRR